MAYLLGEVRWGARQQQRVGRGAALLQAEPDHRALPRAAPHAPQQRLDPALGEDDVRAHDDVEGTARVPGQRRALVGGLAPAQLEGRRPRRHARDGLSRGMV
jgi:hypothetical protein